VISISIKTELEFVHSFYAYSPLRIENFKNIFFLESGDKNDNINFALIYEWLSNGDNIMTILFLSPTEIKQDNKRE
jgi:hypothetical protein